MSSVATLAGNVDIKVDTNSNHFFQIFFFSFLYAFRSFWLELQIGTLIPFITVLQNTFNKFDQNNGGEMETVELRDALRELSKL